MPRRNIQHYRGDETADEAVDRYYREESSAQGGLFTPGGATAGGIFGDVQIVTESLDGPAVQRHLGAVRSAGMAEELRRELATSRRIQKKMLERLEELERRQLGGKRGRRPEEELDDDDDDDDTDY